MNRPHLHWTAIAGALFAWNVLARARHGKFATDYFREHPALTATFLIALANHLRPHVDAHRKEHQ